MSGLVAGGTPTIVVVDPQGARRPPMTLSTAGLTLGREAGNDIVIEDGMVSRQHLRIGWNGQTATVTDLGSSNGTILGDTRIAPHEQHPWTPGTWLRLGGWFLILDLPSASVSTSPGHRVAQPDWVTPVVSPRPGGDAPPSTLNVGGAPHPPVPGTAHAGTPAGPSGGRIRVVLDSNTLSVTPGQPAVVRVTLANTGPTVDHLRVSVEGIPEAWITGPNTAVQLVPGGQATVALTVNVARSAQNRSGAYPVTVRAQSRDNPGETGAAAAMWTVLPFEMGALTITPARVIGRTEGQYELSLRNDSNTAASYQLTGGDEEQVLRFRFRESVVNLEPASVAQTPLVVRAPRRLAGSPLPRRFNVRAINTSGGSPPQEIPAEFVHRALVPTWVPPLILVGLIGLGVLAWQLLVTSPVINAEIVPNPPITGRQVTIVWEAENADSIEVEGFASDLNPDDRRFVIPSWPAGTTDLTVKAKNRWDSDNETLVTNTQDPVPTPTAEPGAPVIVLFEVLPEQVEPGAEVTIRWEVTGADDVTIEPFGTVDAAGQMTARPQAQTTYSLIASNSSKTVRRSSPIIVLGDDILQPPVAQATQAPQAPQGSQPTQAPVVQPTQAPVATATVPPTEPMATATMEPTQVPSAGGAVAINGEQATVITALDDSGRRLLADVGGVLQRSEDGGMTWMEAGPTPQGRILAAINNPDVLYAGDNPDCDTGEPVLQLVRSTDGGLTWSGPIRGWEGMRPFHVEALDPDFLVASNCAPHFSPDSGVTLEGFDTFLGDNQFLEGDVVSVAASGNDFPDQLAMAVVDNNERGTLVVYLLGDRFVGPFSPVVVLTFDGAGVVAWADDRIYLATDRGIFVSEDNGSSFTGPNRDGLTQVTLNTSPRGTFFDPADQGKQVGFSAVVVNPDDPQDLFIAGREGVYRSRDGGVTWTQLAEMREVQSLAVAFEADRFYASDGVTTRSWTLDGR